MVLVRTLKGYVIFFLSVKSTAAGGGAKDDTECTKGPETRPQGLDYKTSCMVSELFTVCQVGVWRSSEE